MSMILAVALALAFAQVRGLHLTTARWLGGVIFVWWALCEPAHSFNYSGSLSGTTTVVNGDTFSGIINNNGTLIFNRTDIWTNASPINGIGAVQFTAAGTVTFTAVNSYVGTTTISTGVLDLDASPKGQLYASGAAVSSNVVVLNNNGNLKITSWTNNGSLGTLPENSDRIFIHNGKLTVGGSFTSARGFRVGSGGATLQVNAGKTYVKSAGGTPAQTRISVASGGFLKITGSGNTTLEDSLGSNGADLYGGSNDFEIQKEGTGTLRLNQTNFYTGATRLNAGTTVIGANGSTASSTSTVVAAGATLQVNGKSGPVIVQGSGSLEGSGTISSLTIRSNGVLRITSTSGTWNTAGTINFDPGSVLDLSGLSLNQTSYTLIRGSSVSATPTLQGAANYTVANTNNSITLTALSGLTQVFSNNSAVSIEYDTTNSSTIAVSGVASPGKLTVKINGFSHDYPNEADIFLMSPSGLVCSLLSDAGDGVASGLNLIFDDAASGPAPTWSSLTSTTYRPTDVSPGETLPPGGTGAIGTSLQALLAGNPNGDWKLFVSDDTEGDNGTIISWSLTFGPSDDANLSGLSLSNGTLNPAFDAGTTSYAVTLGSSVTSLKVTPTAAQANATIEVRVGSGSFASVASGADSASWPLSLGSNPVEVRVTAQDGTTTKTYTVHVTVTPPNSAPVASGSATLAAVPKGVQSYVLQGERVGHLFLKNFADTNDASWATGLFRTEIPWASPGRSVSEQRNDYAFAALKGDGSVVTWGNSTYGGDSSGTSLSGGVTEIFATDGAFAALKIDGSVVTWGDVGYGGDSSGKDLSSGVVEIFSGNYAFAALKTNGSVVAWGNTNFGGNSSSPTGGHLTNGVVKIFSNEGAFAALKTNGSVVTWGSPDYGGNSSIATYSSGSYSYTSVANQLTNGVVEIFANAYAFAALKRDGSVVTWGEADFGGNSSGVSGSLTSGVIRIYANNGAFAALKADGTVVTWGDAVYGANSSSVAAQLTGVVTIATTVDSFAALKSDGSVVAWPSANPGGDASSASSSLTNGVVKIFSTWFAFAALKSDGSVVAWGTNGGGNTSGVDFSGGVAKIESTGYAFAALKNDGSVVTWGTSFYGGSGSASGVTDLFATPQAFAALRGDGSVVAWGDGLSGGSTYSVSGLVSEGVVTVGTPAQKNRLVRGHALTGVAVTANAANSSQGLWQYSTNGFNWVNVPTTGLSDSSALLLDNNAQLRFAPLPSFAGTPGGLTVRLIETGSSLAVTTGTTANVSQNGGTNSVSSGTVVLTTSVTTPDTNPPTIALNGNALVLLESGDAYTDAGATVTDDVDTSVPLSVSIRGTTIPVPITYSDSLFIGDVIDVYTITYRAQDAAGNQATPVTRTVKVFLNGYLAWANGYGLFGASVPDMDGDGDLDGKDNLGEFTAGTDPGKVDTDGDGISDNTDTYPLTANHNFDVYLGLVELCRQDSASGPVPDYPLGASSGAVFEKLIYANAPAGSGLAKVEVRKGGSVVDGGDLSVVSSAGLGRIEFAATNQVVPNVLDPADSQWEQNLLPHGNYTFRGLAVSGAEVTNVTVKWNDGKGADGAGVIPDYPGQAPRLTSTNWANGDLCLPNGTNAVLTWANNWTNHLEHGWIRVEIERRSASGSPERYVQEIAVTGSNLPTQIDLGAKGFLTNNTHYTGRLIFSIWKDGAVRGKQTRFHLVTGPKSPPSAPAIASLVAANDTNKVGPISSTDPDGDDPVQLSLPAGSLDNHLFVLEGSDLRLRSGAFDRATRASYQVLVRATDATGMFAESVLTLTVLKRAQTISFGGLDPKVFGDSNFSAGATTDSGLPISFTSSNPGVAIVVGGYVQILGAGQTTITASQAGDSVYAAATPVSQTFTVSSTGGAIASGGGVSLSSSSTASSVAPVLQLPATLVYGRKMVLPGALQAARVGENNLHLAIPDGNPAGLSRQLNLTGLSLANYRLTVGLNLQATEGGFGTALGDYYAYLRHSNEGITAQTRVLLNRVGVAADPLGVGSVADGINAIFADAAETNIQGAADPVSGPLTGTFRPTSLLAGSSNGLNSMGSTDWNGTWTLFVEDQQSGGTANLVDWFLQFEDLAAGDAGAGSSNGLVYEVVDDPAVGTDGTDKGSISGNELTASSGTGRITLRAKYAGGSAYTTNLITLQKASQTITFPALGSRSLAPAFSANASTDSGLNLSYSSSDTNVATVDANGVITPRGAGSATITAEQAGDGNFSAASPASQGVTILATPLTPYFGASQLYWQEGTNPAVAGSRTGHLYEPIKYAEASGVAGIANVQIVGAAAFYLSSTSQPSAGVVGYSEMVSPGMNSGFTSWSGLTNSLKNGNYEFQGKNSSLALVTNAALTWSNSSNFPIAVPRLGGSWVSKALRLADPTTAGTVTWESWSTRPSNGLIRLELEPEGYSSGGRLSSFLPADTNQFEIPAGFLGTNRIYQLRLSFGVREADGGVHANQTQVRVATGPNYPPSAPVLTNAVAGMIGVREGTNLVGTLELPTDQDSGDSFTTSLPSLSGNASALDNYLFELIPNGADASRMDLRLISGNFDHTAKSQYQILVRHTDGFGLYSDTAYTVSVSRSQTITFSALPAKTYGDSALDLEATASSGLEVSYASSDPNVAEVTGNRVTIKGAGSATISASQAGGGEWLAAEPVQQVLTVSPKSLTVGAPTILAREYNGQKAANSVQVGTLSGFVHPETVIATATAADYPSANVGTYSNVVVTYTLQDGTNGGKASNYRLANGSATGVVTAKELTVGLPVIAPREYDGTKTAGLVQVGSLVGFVSSEIVTATAVAADYSSADVGTYSNVMVTYSLANGNNGGLATNYRIPDRTATGIITGKTLGSADILLTAPANLVFNNSPKAFTASATGIGGESVSFSLGYESKGGGGTFSPLAGAPTAAGDYRVTATATGNYGGSQQQEFTISKASSTISVTGSSVFTYSSGPQGPTAVSRNGSTGEVTLTYEGVSPTSYTGSTNRPVNAGTYRVVASLAGDENHESANSAPFPFTIGKATLLVGGITGKNKIYNGNRTADINGLISLTGWVGSDSNLDANHGGAALVFEFEDANVGVDKSITVSGGGLLGAKAGNYQLGYPTDLKANITAKPLTGTFTAEDKEYSGNDAATVATRDVSGKVGGDEVNHTGGTARFDSAAVGNGKTVTLTGATLTGAAAGNYSLSSVTATTASITRKALTIAGASATPRAYDGSTNVVVSGGSLQGVVEGDTVNLGGSPVGTVATAAVGNDKPVTVTGYTLSGTDAGNYSLTQPSTLTVSISKATQTISFTLSAPSVLSSAGTFSLTALASSGLPVSFEATPTSVATVAGNNLNLVAPGTVTITAKQAGNENYEAAADVSRSLQVLDSDLPIAGADSVTAAPIAGSVVKYAVAQLLANDRPSANGSDTRTLSLTAVSATAASGSSVSRKGGWVIYQPNAAALAAGTDSFTYTLSNGSKTATGAVTIALAMPDFTLQIQMESLADRPGGGKTVTFAVSPEKTFEVQATSDLTNWTTIHAGVTSLSDGRLVVEDPGAGSLRFYRVRWIP